MERSKFIFIIDAELQYNVLVRIVGALNRQRIPILELNSQSVKRSADGDLQATDDKLRVTLSVEDTKQNVVKLSKKINREVDVIEVSLFEKL